MPFLGGDPWSGLTRELRKHGHRVSVLTTGAYGHLPSDDQLGLVRTADLTSSGPLRRLLKRPPLSHERDTVAVSKPPPKLLTRTLVPDPFLLSWGAWAIPAARQLVKRGRIDCVITTSPPNSNHLVGLGLGRSRPAWLADFRDGWIFEPLHEPFPTSLQRRLDERFEKHVVRTADRVIAATQPLIEDLQFRYGADGCLVPNIWDEELETEVAQATPPPLDHERVNLVFTGRLAGVRGQDDRGLFEALSQLAEQESDVAARLRLVIAGQVSPDRAAILERPELRGLVQMVGALPRPAAVALQRRADALLLVTSHHRSIATGKLSEYLQADRPILALAGDNEAARIVRQTQTGEVVAPDDIPAIVQALKRVAARSLTYAPRQINEYTASHAALTLAEEIETAIAARERSYV
jgi:glycosyltransferase involved in cell wall biosynthesis